MLKWKCCPKWKNYKEAEFEGVHHPVDFLFCPECGSSLKVEYCTCYCTSPDYAGLCMYCSKLIKPPDKGKIEKLLPDCKYKGIEEIVYKINEIIERLWSL